MIYYDLPMKAYLDHPGIGSSLLKKILVTPADYKAATQEKKKETKATSLGTLIHTVILEPDFFDDRYAVQPADWGPLNENPGAALWKKFKKDNAGKECVKYEDGLLIKRVYDAARKNEALDELLNDCRPEVTSFRDINGITLKARTDLFDDQSGLLADVKTTSESLNDNNIFKIIFSNGYHFQAAHHMTVFDCFDRYRWIFVSTQSSAVHIRVVHAPTELLDWGIRDHKYCLQKLSECLENNDWPGYSSVVNNLELPDWARKMYE